MFERVMEVFSQYKGLSKSVYVIFFARIITNMGAFIWPMLTLIFSRKMGYSASTIAIMTLMIGLLFLPANIIGGKLADKFNRKKIIIIFDLISITFFLACSFIEPGTLMVVFFVLAGLFANLEGPAFEALIADSTKPSEREKVYSLSYLGHNLGFAFGITIGGLLFENYLNIAFIIDGLTTLTSTILIIMFVNVINVNELNEDERNEYEDQEEDDVTSIDVLKQRKPIFIQLIVFMLAAFIYDQWSFVLPLYFKEIFSSKGAQFYGFLGGFNALIVIFFTPVITILFKRFNELPKIMIGLLLYSFSFLIIVNTQFYWIFFIMMFAFTIGEIINTLGASPYISRRVPSSHRGRISSYRNIGYFIGSVVGRLVMGVLIDVFSYNVAFITLTIMGSLAALLVSYNYRLDKKIFPKLYTDESKI